MALAEGESLDDRFALCVCSCASRLLSAPGGEYVHEDPHEAQ